MNLNNYALSLGSANETWYNTGTGFDVGDELYFISALRADFNGADEPLPHLGFRGGKVFAGNDSEDPAPAGTYMLYVGWSDDPEPASFGDITTTWSLDVTSTSPGADQTIGPCLAPMSSGPNARKYWFAVRKYTIPSSGDGGGNDNVLMSPRTDIPLWITAVTGNKIAVGGTLP